MESDLTRITHVPNPKHKRSGTISYVHLLNKYKFSPTKPGPYSLGGKVQQKGKTPGHTFNLDFETGSADPVALAYRAAQIDQYLWPQRLRPEEVSTFKKTTGAAWKISYGDGSNASGDVGTDKVNIGNLVIKNQTIELVKQISAQFVSSEGDDLRGLAFGSINTGPQPVTTPVENVTKQTDVPKTSEAVHRLPGLLQRQEGSRPWHLSLHIRLHRRDCRSWNATASVSSKNITRRGNTAIAVTGTTLVALVNDALGQAIYDAIPGAQKEDHAFADAGNNMTYGDIQSRGDSPFDLLGDTWLKGIYAILDQGNMRFGAVVRHEPTQEFSVP
ncbi:MAG: hypothetical protein Q9184_001070 [Pyrenodesmia sp. 2 TL-2023]